MSFDPIALLERAYRPSAGPEAWLSENAPHIGAPLDADERGTISYFVRDFRPRPDSIEFRPGPESDLTPEAAVESVLTGSAHLSPEQVRRGALAMQRPGVHGFVETFGGMVQPAIEPLDRPVADSPALIIPTGGRDVAVVATFVARRFSVEPERRTLWERIAIHLGAACRLSAREPGPEAADVEAVLDPGGRILDARGGAKTGEARGRLGAAARRLDRARTRPLRASPLRALELWQGLFAGRWSLVDHVESDGRRVVLARRNEPAGRGPGALSRRQRQVLFYASVGWTLRQIAYALGLSSTGTVSHHLSAALRKVGVPSRAELVRLTAEAAMGGAPAGGANGGVPPAGETAGNGARAAGGAPNSGLAALTEAERRVADLAAAGWSNRRIADRRGVRPHTVANQLTSVYRKLGVRDRFELARRWSEGSAG